MIGYRLFSRIQRVIDEVLYHERPTYVAVKPDVDSIEGLVELAETIGLSNSLMVPEKDLHATVIYSRKPIKDPTRVVENTLPLAAIADEVHFFKSRDGKDCLVVKLSSVKLRGLHVAIRNAFGASHDFPTFEAHITLCYDTPADLVARLKKHPPEVDLPLTFDDYEVKELDA